MILSRYFDLHVYEISKLFQLQFEIYPESGCIMTCNSYLPEISNPQYAKCLCNEEFIVLEKYYFYCYYFFFSSLHQWIKE